VTRILLVRHGQSVWNADGRWQGQADPELTDLGLTQAAAAAGAIGSVDAMISSPLQRAHRTASIIAAAIGIEPVVSVDGLMERSAGEWEGLTRAEIDHRYPGFLAERRRPPGYESDDSVLQRAMVALDAISAAVGQGADVVAVTHGGVIATVTAHLGAERTVLGNLGAWWIGSGPSGWVLGERVRLIDDDLVTVPGQI